MGYWLDRCPVFVRKLWCQLAVSYTLLTFCAMMLLFVMLYGVNDYSDFHETYTPENVRRQINSEKLAVAQAILDAGNHEWLSKAQNNIREKLINLESGTDTILYRITNSSRPEVYIQIADENDRILAGGPANPPDAIAKDFALRKSSLSAEGRVERLTKDGPIWVDIPVTGEGGRVLGRLRVLYIAEFSWWVELQSVLDFLLFICADIFLLSVPIGIACGLIASYYVTSQLQKMNEVTESWRQGNFKPRIALPSDDVLIRHSKHLNEMAHELEQLINLKQSIAAGDERNRVARELHDTVKQKLFALSLQLEVVKSKPALMASASENILEAETITREAQADLMEIITQLRPPGTIERSFLEQIAAVADDFERRYAVRIDVSRMETGPCSANTEHHIVRIVQEALTNAIHHGKATEITITARIDGTATILVIEDNGVGFDTTAPTGGFGLVSMRDRISDLLHCTFTLESSPGAGTRITISWINGL